MILQILLVLILVLSVSLPAGYVPGTDVYVIRESEADVFRATVQNFAQKVKDGMIITDTGYSKFKEMDDAIMERIATDRTKVLSVKTLRVVTTSDVLREYTADLVDDRNLIVLNYSSK